MKQKLMITGILFLLGITSCKKNALEETAAPQELTGKESTTERASTCRLVSAVRDDVYGEFLQYNSRGLVSEWKEDYFDGFPYIVTYTYDQFGRLKTGHSVNTYYGTAFDVKYQYQGNRLIKHTVYEAGTNNVVNEIVNTYNYLGQIVKRASTYFPIYCTFNYNWQGNNTLVNYYVDNALYLKEEFTYRQFNRNPFLAAHGIPYVTYTYDFLFSKCWQTSEKYTLYDNGTATVTGDLTPETAVLTLGPQQYLTSITNFDRVEQANTSAYFTYDNCNCAPAKIISGKKAQPNSTAAKLIALTRLKQLFEAGDIQKIKSQMARMTAK